MRVVISDDGPDEFEYDFDQEAVILGRGSNCDIVLQSDHISRKHLEISRKNGIFFIKDLTLSNWVSYNDEKLHKNVEVQYFDFAPLLLPGGFSVKIEDENEVLNDTTYLDVFAGCDLRFKEDISKLAPVLDKLGQIEPINFKYTKETWQKRHWS